MAVSGVGGARGHRYLRARLGRVVIGLGLLVGLAGCGLFNDEEILEGERIAVRSESVAETGTLVTASLPAPVANSEWTQTNGSPTHNAGHLAGPASLNRVWARNIGTGSSKRAVITSAPIVVGGRIYVLDAAATVIAVDAGSGSEQWRLDLTPEGEKGEEGYGGGLAYDSGRVYATTGFGEVLAIDPAAGEILWRKSYGAPFRAAPAAAGSIVVAVTRDNRSGAVDGATGELRWRIQGATADAGLLGGASPAITRRLTVLPFTSGELIGVDTRTGRRLWSAVLSGGRRGLARAAITDVSGDPVIVGPYVIAANQSGRMLAVDGRTGQRVWTRNIGSRSPLWAAGDTIFLVSDDSRLMRVSARDGSTLWAVDLPAFRKPGKRKGPIEYSGPVLVAGRLLVTDSLGNLIAFDAETGAEVERDDLDGGSLTGPVVAGGTVYVLSDRGTLHAFR